MSTTSSRDRAAISQLLDQINAQGRSFLTDNDEKSRLKVLVLMEELTPLLETPATFIQKLTYGLPSRDAAIRIAVDLGILELLKNSDESSDVAGISSRTKAESAPDPTLVARIMKHLAAFHIIQETSPGMYRSTTLSNGLTQPNLRDGMICLQDTSGPTFLNMPAYFKTKKYQSPHDAADAPFQFAHKTALPFFPFISERPETLKQFNNYMTCLRQDKKAWLDIYPAESRLIQGFQESTGPFIVDVGGGLGHDLLALRRRFPNLSGDFILQDRQEVVSAVHQQQREQNDPLGLPFHAEVHDFFSPQPSKHAHARVYFLHSILHDWDDAHCLTILQHVASAMKADAYSKLLVHEYVVPDLGATWLVTSTDLLMMSMGSQERTEEQFRSLLAESGLEMAGVWVSDGQTEGIIEAVLAGGRAEI